MSFPISDALTLIRSALLLLKEEDPAILSSLEDAAYFRARASRAHESLVHSDSARQTHIDPKQSDRSAPFPSGKGGTEEARFDKIADGPRPPNLKEHGIKADLVPQPPSISQAKPAAADKIDQGSSPASMASSKITKKETEIPPLPVEPKAETGLLHQKDTGSRKSLLRSILQKIAPELAILDSIPDDAAAKQIATRWKTKNQSAPISILSSGELPEHKALLAEIAAALDVYFGPARFIEADPIEKEKQWKMFLSVGSLKMIVVCDSTLWQLHNLRQFYKETPATGVRMLGDVPIFLLPDLSLYLKDPLLKRSLWKALCSKLS
jgi:hypothetical protein